MFEKYLLNTRTNENSKEIEKFLQNQKFWHTTIDPKNNM